MAREQRIAQVFVELADTLVDEFDAVGFLQTLTERCVELLDVDAAGLLLDDQRGGLQLIASTDESARLLELFQLQRNQGPCLDCFSTGQAIPNIDLPVVGYRWPAFAEAAIAVGFSSAHSLPLRLRGAVIGAMNLFNHERVELDADQLALAQGLADVATIGLLHERVVRDQSVLSEQLQTALNSRILIEQAKGVLSERVGVGVAEAFTLMRTHARRSGRSLTSVAQAVVDGSIDAGALQRT